MSSSTFALSSFSAVKLLYRARPGKRRNLSDVKNWLQLCHLLSDLTTLHFWHQKCFLICHIHREYKTCEISQKKHQFINWLSQCEHIPKVSTRMMKPTFYLVAIALILIMVEVSHADDEPQYRPPGREGSRCGGRWDPKCARGLRCCSGKCYQCCGYDDYWSCGPTRECREKRCYGIEH